MSPTDARGGETVVNTPKMEITPVSERPPPVSSVRYVYIARMCVSVCGSQRERGELYSTLRYIGKPEKFPSGGGVGCRGERLEKTAQVLCEQEN